MVVIDELERLFKEALMAYLKMTDCLKRSIMPIKVSISVPGFRSETHQAQDVPNTK